MSVDQHKAILMQGAEAFNNLGDRSGWFEIHDPSVVAHGLAREPLDFAGLERFYAGLWSGFPDLRITVDDLIGEREKVAWRLSVRGTHEGEFRGVAPTGIAVRFAAQYMFESRERQIIERWTNFDRLSVLVQLGAVPSPV